jgi:predicted GNAT family acetyltransferase
VRSRRFGDARRFLEHIAPLVGGTEARHNLMLGLAGTLTGDPEIYPDFSLWAVDDERGVPVAAALRTLDYRVVLSDAFDPAAATALADLVFADAPDAPGAVGNRPTVEWFCDAWTRLSRCGLTVTMEQAVWALEQVSPVPEPGGRPRAATPDDHELIEAWVAAFTAEALAEDPASDDRLRRHVGLRLRGPAESAGFWLWEHRGDAVSLSGHANPTPTGIRIGPVYTPPEHRGRGYATALVAAESAWLLEHGREVCFLYTDLANPTSNSVYRRIGYRQVAESVECLFDR